MALGASTRATLHASECVCVCVAVDVDVFVCVAVLFVYNCKSMMPKEYFTFSDYQNYFLGFC